MALNELDTRDPRLERLYRDAAREAPPAHLDAAILAAARREVGARPRGLSAALRRWQVPVSIAAVVVVTVSLVVLMKEEGLDRLSEARGSRQEASADRPSAGPSKAPSVAPEMKAAQPPAESPALAERRASRDDAKRSLALGKMVESERSREAGSAAIPGIGTAVTEPATEQSPTPFVASPALRAREQPATPAPPDTAGGGRLEAASPKSVEERTAAPAADAPRPKLMARGAVAKPTATDRPPVWQDLEKEPPEKWLARIEELAKEERAAEAEELRAEFKRRFPDHPSIRAPK